MASRVFIDVLPSPVMCSGNPTIWDSFEVKSAYRMAIYPAFASDGPGRPQHPFVNVQKALSRIPSNGGNLNGMPPKRNIPFISVNPTEDNKIYMVGVDAKDDDPLDVYPIDTVVYEIFEKMDARNYFDEALRNLRRFTRQVWIGRAATYTDRTTSCAFEFTDERKAHGLVLTFGPLHFRFKSIRLCTQEIWREAWRLAMAPSAELGVDVVHSVHHALLSDDEQQFFLQSGIAIERLKYMLWDFLRSTNACTAPQHRAALNDTNKPHRYFSECLKEVVSRSLLDENPRVNLSVKQLWIARGIIAHGKPLPENLSSADKVADVENLYELARFVDSIRGVKYPALVL